MARGVRLAWLRLGAVQWAVWQMGMLGRRVLRTVIVHHLAQLVLALLLGLADGCAGLCGRGGYQVVFLLVLGCVSHRFCGRQLPPREVAFKFEFTVLDAWFSCLARFGLLSVSYYKAHCLMQHTVSGAGVVSVELTVSCLLALGLALAKDLNMSDFSRLRVGACALAAAFLSGIAAASTCGADLREVSSFDARLFPPLGSADLSSLTIAVLLGRGAAFAAAVLATGAVGGGGLRPVLLFTRVSHVCENLWKQQYLDIGILYSAVPFSELERILAGVL